MCDFHAMTNPVTCRLLPNEWCSSPLPPPYPVCSCCSSWAGCSTDLITWEQDHLVEPLKKWFAVRFTAHSCITVMFKTKQVVENTECVKEHTAQQLWPYTACRERDRGKALFRVSHWTLTWGYFGLVAHDPHGPSVHPGKSNHDVPGIGWHDLKEFPLIHNLQRGEARQRCINTQANTNSVTLVLQLLKQFRTCRILKEREGGKPFGLCSLHCKN